MATVDSILNNKQSNADEITFRDEKIPRMRKSIAMHMCGSLSTMAQLTHMATFDATALIRVRSQLKSSDNEALRAITYNDIILFVVSQEIKKFPVLNANWLDEQGCIRYFDHVHLGVAVNTERGLLVPTLFHADKKDLVQISQEAKELAGMAKSGRILPDLLTGASFTVTNLGRGRVEYFTPIINPPQTGILGVGSISYRVRVDDVELMEVYPAMGLSLTFDHRAVDGAPAAQFLESLCEALENFSF